MTEKSSMEACRVPKSDRKLLVIVSCLIGGSATFLAFYLRIFGEIEGGDDDLHDVMMIYILRRAEGNIATR